MRISFKLMNLTLPLFLVLSLTFTSCASKKKATTGAEDSFTGSELDSDGLNLELYSDSDSGKAGNLQTVYFDFNSSDVSSSTKQSLKNNADFLKSKSNLKIQVEGHADERGSVQYNLALGERRAKAVKNYLTSLGVSSSRISTISYGKERPISMEHSEDSWSKNRRANFVIVEK